MNILFIQAASVEAIDQERAIVEALEKALGDDFSIIHPSMPNADDPHYTAWAAAIQAELEKCTGRVVLLGHSLGGSVLLKLLSNEPVPEHILGMVLFGVPFWGKQSWDVSEFGIEDSAKQKLAKLKNVHFIHSIDDETVPYSHLDAYRKLMPQADFQELSGVDHSYHGAIETILADVQQLIRNDT